MRHRSTGVHTLDKPPPQRGDRWIMRFWILGLAALSALGVFSWFYIRPVLQLNAVCPMTQDNIAATGEGDDYWEREGRRIRERLGQPAEVVAKVRLYLRMPAWFAAQKASAVELLGLCGDEGVPMLIEVLDDRGQPVSDRFTQPTRSAAARALGRLRARVAVEPLEKALVTKYPDVRKTSARALGLIGDERSVDALSSLLANDDDVNVRLDTVRALAAMNKVELVVRALKDGSASVRREAAWCLGMMNAAQAVGGLVQVLRDEDWNVRIWGIRALAKIGGARALEALQTCLNDPDPRVKECAEQAVYELKLKLKESVVPVNGSTIPSPHPEPVQRNRTPVGVTH